MWQRIQTLWLLLAGISMTLLLFFPLAVIDKCQLFSLWLLNSNHDIQTITWELFSLNAIIVLLAFVCIFLFKKRKLQMRLCIYNMLLIVGFLVVYVIRCISVSNNIKLLTQQEASIVPTIWNVLPFISLVFLFLAFRAIRRDEVLIRMSKRLR